MYLSANTAVTVLFPQIAFLGVLGVLGGSKSFFCLSVETLAASAP
jgi:hypothetical protein